MYDLKLHEITRDHDIGEMVELMRHDKKVKDGTLRLVLLKDLGQPYLYNVAETDFVENSWQQTFKIFY